ncbi:fibronectin type III domain-containing protein [Streptomonospora halophila]|uniref:fibronectin type III domain-containing protein n=1 Tax=Streptomonospora halophila TaxID=427369 RepID=UPI0031EAF9F0
MRSVAPASVGAAGDGTLPSSAHRPDAEPRVPAHAPDSGPTEQGHGDAAPPDGGRPSGDRYAFARVLVTAVLAAGIAVALVGGAALGVAWWMGSGAVGGRQATDPTAQPRGEASAPIPPSLPPQASENPALAPTDVRIVSDEGNTVTLSWTDNTSGRASYHVVGGPVGTAPSTLAEGEPLSTRITITGLNPSFDYCFTVMAVASVDEVAPSENACTQRASDV